MYSREICYTDSGQTFIHEIFKSNTYSFVSLKI